MGGGKHDWKGTSGGVLWTEGSVVAAEPDESVVEITHFAQKFIVRISCVVYFDRPQYTALQLRERVRGFMEHG